MRPLSNDLRERIIAAVDYHEGSRRQIARRFMVDVSCLTRLLQLRRRDRFDHAEATPWWKGAAPLMPKHWTVSVVSSKSGLTQRSSSCKSKTGVGGSIMIIGRALKKLGITPQEEDQARR